YCHAISTCAESAMARMVFFWSVISGALSRASMWGGGRARTSTLASMDAAERAGEILGQPLEWQIESGAPADQHVVISSSHAGRRRKPHHLPQPPPHAIALGRVADLLGNGKSHPHRSILAPIQRLQHESADGGPSTGCGGQ